MSYELQYDLQSIKIIKNPQVKKQLHTGIIIFALIFGCIAGHILSTALQISILKPSENTMVAADNMAERMRNNTPIGEAIEIFCQEISE